ncbi:MAG TPA: helix-turn-helix domain-containing protein [Nocardioides sp.]|uniref:helix-turn-helix domain-containing protein n=1 Tax=Nocardioides sp. TaxID=35761 RepID=UPI002F3EB0C4
MPRRRAVSVLSALGVSADDERRYQQLLPLSGSRVHDVAAALGVEPDRVRVVLSALVDCGVVRFEDGRITVLRADQALAAAISREAAAADLARDRLDDLARAVPLLVAARTRPAPGEVEDVQALDGELSSGGNALELLTAMIEQSRGDLLFLRPDAWQMPRESAISRVVARAIASGRRSRAVYPLRALHEAPETLHQRVDGGEEVRLIDEMPTRLMVIGVTHAIVPEPLGYSDSPRLLVRQGALVAALTLLFELYWEKAVPVSELSGPRSTERTFLLRQLQAGAKDEQISRTMGLSLRTVRRRISDLMIELGADTRFQAGAEAARRGWL